MVAVLSALSAPNLSVSGGPREVCPLTWPDVSAAVVPNFSEWQAGDVVLVKSDGSTVGKVVEGVQGSVPSSMPPIGDPAWTHAALYVGMGMLIETAPGNGVRYCPVHAYAQSRDLRVRRLLRGGAPISRGEGDLVVREAGGFFQQGYSYWAVARHLLNQMAHPEADKFFCSTFIAVVYSKALKVVLDMQAAHRPLLPATLVNHPAFADLDLEWRRPV